MYQRDLHPGIEPGRASPPACASHDMFESGNAKDAMVLGDKCEEC